MAISEELRAGIEAYQRRTAPLLGKRVTAVVGERRHEVTGTFVALGHSGCQHGVLTAAGKCYEVIDIDSVRIVKASEAT